MCEDSEHHMFNGALLFEDHTRQIKEHLVPLHFELALLIQLSIPQPNAAELQIAGEHFLIIACEACICLFVDHLQQNWSSVMHIGQKYSTDLNKMATEVRQPQARSIQW
jgi:hypothetical protein